MNMNLPSSSSFRRAARSAGLWVIAGLASLGPGIEPLAAQTLSLVAGNPSGSASDGQQAAQTRLGSVTGIAIDGAGNLYIGEGDPVWRVRKVAPNGVVTSVAGNGLPAYSGGPLGDGGPALAVSLDPRRIAVDAAGTLFVYDAYRGRIRKVTTGGIITTYAGGGASTADGVQATAASMTAVNGMAVDSSGNLLLSDGSRLRKIATNGIITTIANQANVLDFGGDGGLAINAYLRNPRGIAVAADGSVYSADWETRRIRRIGADGIIRTVVGGGPYRFDPVATKVDLWLPEGVTADAAGNIVFTTMKQVWQVSKTGILRLVAGRFCDSLFSDKCPTNPRPLVDVGLTNPEFGNPVIDASGGVYFFDSIGNKVYKVSGLGDPPTPPGVGAFEPYLSIPITGQTNAVQIADVTGDGRSDLVVLTQTSIQPQTDDNSLLVFVQQPSGALATATKVKITTGIPVSLGLFDFNADGIRDILVSTVVQGLSSPKLLVFDGNPAGSFAARTLDAGYLSGPLYNMDVDHDGLVDVVGYGYVPGPVVVPGLRWLRGNGQGGIQGDTFIPTKAGSKLVRGDFNSDGLDDFLAADASVIEIVPQLPAGGFGVHKIQAAPGLHRCCASVAVGDANHDGRDDLLLAGEGNSPVWLYYYLQDTNGKLEGPRLEYVYDSPGPMVADDINGDGRDDVVMMHISWDAIGYLQQTASGLAAETKFRMPPYTSIFNHMLGMAVGDLDNDGCRDVVVADYNYGAVVHYGQNCVQAVAATSDLDRDGRSDMVWRSGSGAARAWLSGLPVSALTLSAVPGWSLAAVDDFDGDGGADLFWRQCSSGRTGLQSGLRAAPRPASTVSDNAWSLVGSGDLDGDGSADLVWQRGAAGWVTTWPAANGRRERRLGRAPGSGWKLAGIGDLDGDGRGDLFWRKAGSGETQFWSAGDPGRAWRGAAMQDQDWIPVGLGDLDGNGKADILWRHRRLGANQAWMDGRLELRRVLASVPDTGWQLAAVADYDGDRRADLFWHHVGTGANRIWKGGDATTPIEPGKAAATLQSLDTFPACSAPMRGVRARF